MLQSKSPVPPTGAPHDRSPIDIGGLDVTAYCRTRAGAGAVAIPAAGDEPRGCAVRVAGHLTTFPIALDEACRALSGDDGAWAYGPDATPRCAARRVPPAGVEPIDSQPPVAPACVEIGVVDPGQQMLSTYTVAARAAWAAAGGTDAVGCGSNPLHVWGGGAIQELHRVGVPSGAVLAVAADRAVVLTGAAWHAYAAGGDDVPMLLGLPMAEAGDREYRIWPLSAGGAVIARRDGSAAWVVDDRFWPRYAALGGPTGALGEPTVLDGLGSATVQHFARGALPIELVSGGGDPCGSLPADGSPVIVRLGSSFKYSDQDTLAGLVDRFNAEHPAIRIVIDTASSYDGAIGPNPPVIERLESARAADAVRAGAVVPIGPCLARDGVDPAALTVAARQPFTVDGTLAALPFALNADLLLYNRRTLAAAGLDPDLPPTTWAELARDAATLEAAGMVSPIVIRRPHVAIERNLVEAMDADGSSALAARTIALLDVLQDLARSLRLRTVPTADSRPNAVALAGNPPTSAFTLENSASLPVILDALSSGIVSNATVDDLGVAPAPLPDAQSVPVLKGTGLFVTAGRSPAEVAGAVAFLAWLARPDTVSTWAAAHGYVPIRADAAAIGALARRLTDPRWRVIVDCATRSEVRTTTFTESAAADAVDDAVRDALDAVLDGRATAVVGRQLIDRLTALDAAGR